MFNRIIKLRSSHRVLTGFRWYKKINKEVYFPLVSLHLERKSNNYLIRSPTFYQSVKLFSENNCEIDAVKFEDVCGETLESLCEYFEEIVEENSHLKGADVVYGDGVLTVALGESYGTYVINRQTPNKQIWLSSPTSGPKRYDFVGKDKNCWIYKHDGMSLHKLLQNEISNIAKKPVDFSKCSFSLV